MGILKGRRYTYQWSSMFILLYFIEGVMRAWSDRGLSARLALGEIALSLVFFSRHNLLCEFDRALALRLPKGARSTHT